jgi:hypothetical protein
MKKFLISLYVFIQLYKMGYFWSGGFHRDWGFYRLNYEKGATKEYALIDIDFSTEKDHPYSHIHGGKTNSTIFRVDGDKITESSKTEPIFLGKEKSHVNS